MDRIRQRLKRIYGIGLGGAAAGFMVVTAFRGLAPWEGAPHLPLAWARALFAAAVILAGAGPILLRAACARHLGKTGHTPVPQFSRMQHALTVMGILPAYLALAALALEVPPFFQAGTLLAALYGIYYLYPSARRLEWDSRIFRVEKPS